MQFSSSKTAWSASRRNAEHQQFSWWRHIDIQVHCVHVFAKNLPWRIFRAINIHLIASTYHFVLSYTFIRLGIAMSSLFLIFQCCYFYVMSQSTFPDQISPAPLYHALTVLRTLVYLMQHFTCIMTILLSVNTRMQSGVKLSSPFIEQAKRPVKTNQTIDHLELM